MNSILNLRNPFDGFSVGGFVDSLSPRGRGGLPGFASGGLVTAGVSSSLRPAVINFDGHSFGVQASEDTLGKLSQASMARRLRSAGRKPGFFGGV
jgi:hypothetical protein